MAGGNRTRGTEPVEVPGSVGALPVGGRQVLGQHAALHRQRLLGRASQQGERVDAVGRYCRVNRAVRYARGRAAGVSGTPERRTSRFQGGPLMMAFFGWLETLSFSQWVRESGSLWAFPMFLFSHTLGMAMVAGGST